MPQPTASRALGLLLIACAIVAAAYPARADYYIAADTTATLGGTEWQPWQVVRDNAGAFSLAVAFPDGTPIDSIHRKASGDWLFSVSEPTVLGGTTYDPRDVILYDGVAYSKFFDGAAAGIPATVNVDTVFLSGGDAGDLIIGFDTPVVLGGTTYGPSDLARYHAAAFTKFFNASAISPSIPATSNLLDADERGGLLYITFDVPTVLGGEIFIPGDVVSWNGTSFELRFRTAGWPQGSAMTALGLGGCLDGDGDGFGDPPDATCPAGAVADCDDLIAATYPGAPQVCDGWNNDCSSPSWPALTGLNDGDDDADGRSECAGDCNDADGTVILAPGLVAGVLGAKNVPVAGSIQMSWTSLDVAAGSSTTYDVVTGLLSTLRAGGLPGAASCAANNLPDTPYTEAAGVCAAGLSDGCWYLMRAQNACGTGSYGIASLNAASPCP